MVRLLSKPATIILPIHCHYYRTTITLCFIVLWSGNFNLILKIDFQAPFVQFNFYFRFVCISSTTFRFVFPSFMPHSASALRYSSFGSFSHFLFEFHRGWMGIYEVYRPNRPFPRTTGLPEWVDLSIRIHYTIQYIESQVDSWDVRITIKEKLFYWNILLSSLLAFLVLFVSLWIYYGIWIYLWSMKQVRYCYSVLLMDWEWD